MAFATIDAGSPDVLISLTATRSAGVVGMVARYQDINNYLRVYHDGSSCGLTKIVAGVATDIISASVALGAGNFVLILSGTEARLFLNGAVVGSVGVAPASSVTIHGMYVSNINNTIDNFQVLPRGTGGEFVGLDAF